MSSQTSPAISLPDKMRAVLLKQAGAAENLFVGETDRPSPKSEEVLIRVHATAINRADIHQRKGNYPPPPGASQIIGLECAGVIVSLGDKVSSLCPSLKLNLRVMALLGGGGYAEYATVHYGSVMVIPESMSFETAAAIPEAYLTAYQLVRDVGKIKQNDVVLVHAAASGVGTSAIQLVRFFGGISIATAGKDEKIAFCQRLGASFGVNYNSFPASSSTSSSSSAASPSPSPMTGAIRNWLSSQNGRSGVDLVLDPVGTSYAQTNFDLLNTDGRWVLYATMGGGDVPNFPLRSILMKRISLTGTTLRTRSTDYKTSLVASFVRDTSAAFESGELKPIIDTVMKIDDVVKAHQRMEADSNVGKIVLTFA